MPEDLNLADRLFSAAASIQGTSFSRRKKTLSNYRCLLFPEIVYWMGTAHFIRGRVRGGIWHLWRETSSVKSTHRDCPRRYIRLCDNYAHCRVLSPRAVRFVFVILFSPRAVRYVFVILFSPRAVRYVFMILFSPRAVRYIFMILFSPRAVRYIFVILFSPRAVRYVFVILFSPRAESRFGPAVRR